MEGREGRGREERSWEGRKGIGMGREREGRLERKGGEKGRAVWKGERGRGGKGREGKGAEREG